MAEIIANLTGVNYTYFDRPVLTDLAWEIQAGPEGRSGRRERRR